MAWPLLLAAVLLPLIGLERVTLRQLAWARDRWLMGLAALTVLWLAHVEWALAVIALAALAQWRGPEQLPSVIVWSAIVATWLLAAQIPPDGRLWLAGAFGALALVHSGFCQWEWIRERPIDGWTGHRLNTACLLAILLPFAPLWAAPLVLVGLVLTQSWTGWLAAAVGLAWLWPWSLVASGAGAVALIVPVAQRWRDPESQPWLDRFTTRGTSLKSAQARLASWRELAGHLSWLGTGPGCARRFLAAVSCPGFAHCEPLEYAVEYGALGVCAMLAMAVRIIPHLRLGDPWSAAVLAGFVTMLGASPARIAPVGGTWCVCAAVVATT